MREDEFDDVPTFRYIFLSAQIRPVTNVAGFSFAFKCAKKDEISRRCTCKLGGEKMKLSTKQKVLAAFLGTIATLLMLFEITVPFIPTFVKLDFSEIPVLIAGFAFGPVFAVYTAGIKIVLNILLNGTNTAGVGELVNFIGSVSFAIPAAWIYYRSKTKKTALFGMVVGTLVATAVLLTANYTIMFPLYAQLMGFSLEQIVATSAAVNPAIHSIGDVMLYALLPFNILKYGSTAMMTAFLYKRVKPFLVSLQGKGEN